MKVKTDDVLTYKDSQDSKRYGTGIVTSVTREEYTILWSGRGLTKYKRSILDGRLEQVFQLVGDGAGLPKERRLRLGPGKVNVSFNENYDRAKIATLCEQLKRSGAQRAGAVADGLEAELLTRKFTLRGPAKAVFNQLAELCDARNLPTCEEARHISQELFFGYVLKGSDFQELELAK